MSLTRPMFRLTLLSTLITATTVSFAAESVPETTLGSLTVTATRSPTLVQNTIAQTTVVDEADLQRYQGQSVLDVLRQQSGFHVTQYGGDGSGSNFYLRGLPAKYVLVLVDGMRYGSLSTGYAELGLIPADQIERIEVLYGASGASLYGADAIGGVIQVFTKGQNVHQSKVAVTMGVGSQDSYLGQITGQYTNDKTALSLSTGYRSTKGINVTKASTGVNTDKDSFDSKNVSLVAKHHLTDAVQVGLTGILAKSDVDNDGGSYQDIHSEQTNAAVTGFIDYQRDKLKTKLSYGESLDESDAYFSSTPSQYDTKQQQANLQVTYDLPVGRMIGGAEWLKQRFEGDTSYTNRERTIKSSFVGYQLNQPRYDIQANLRYDDNSQYGNETTYNLGGSYRVLPNTRVGVSYATGFKMPSLNDVYGKSAGSTWNGVFYPGYEGNTNLKAETSKNWEAFIENSNAYQTTRLTGFRSEIKDGIVPAVAASGNNTRVNRAETEVNGLNLTSDWQIKHTLFGLNYSHQKVEGRHSNDVAWSDVNLVPENTGLVYIGYQHPRFDVRTELQYVDERRDGYSNKRLPSYTLMNLSGNYYINNQLSINTRLNNLTDKQYEVYDGYNTKGINSFVSLTYQWF